MSNPMNGRRQELARADASVLVAEADAQTPPAFHLHLRRSLSMHRLLAASVAAFVFVALVVWALARKPMYTAESLIYVEPLEVRLLNDRSSSGYDPSRYDSYLQQQVQTVERTDTLEAALAKMPAGLWTGPEETIASAIRRLGNALKVDRVLNSYQLSIDVSASNPQAAAAAANAITSAYLEEGRKDEHTRADTRLQLLREEAQRITEEVTQDKAEQASLGKSLGVANPNGPSGNPYDLQSEGLRSQLAIAREAHDAVAAQLASVSGASGGGLSTAANELILTDPSLISIKQTLSQRHALLSDQMAGLTPGNPVYKQDQEETAALDRAMERATDEARERAERQLQEKLRLDLRRTAEVEGRLNGQLAEQTARATGAGPKLQRAAELETDLHRLTTRFAAVDDAIRGLQLETGGPGQAHLALAARVPDAAQPNRSRLVLLLSLPLALLCGVAAAVIANKWDRRLYVGGDVQEVLGFAPMCVLPAPNEVSEAAYDDFMLRLAGGIEGAYRHGGARSFVLTPVSVRTGSRSLLPQLCAKLRQIGFRVVSVGAEDLMPGVNGGAGSRPSESRLRLHAAHTLEGFGASRVQRLLQDFSLVLIQAPPLLGSALTEYVVRCADATILLVESECTDRAELRRAAVLLERLNPQGIGAVLENMPLRYADSVFREAVRAADRSQIVVEPAPERKPSAQVVEVEEQPVVVPAASHAESLVEPADVLPAEESTFEDLAAEAEFADLGSEEEPMSPRWTGPLQHEQHGEDVGGWDVQGASPASIDEFAENVSESASVASTAELDSLRGALEPLRETQGVSTWNDAEDAAYEEQFEAKARVSAAEASLSAASVPGREDPIGDTPLDEQDSLPAEPQNWSRGSGAGVVRDSKEEVPAEYVSEALEETLQPGSSTEPAPISLHGSLHEQPVDDWSPWSYMEEPSSRALSRPAGSESMTPATSEDHPGAEAEVSAALEEEVVLPEDAGTTHIPVQLDEFSDGVVTPALGREDRNEAIHAMMSDSHGAAPASERKRFGWFRRLLGQDHAVAEPLLSESEQKGRTEERQDSFHMERPLLYTKSEVSMASGIGRQSVDSQGEHHAGDIVFSESTLTPVHYQNVPIVAAEQLAQAASESMESYAELPDVEASREESFSAEPDLASEEPAYSEVIPAEDHRYPSAEIQEAASAFAQYESERPAVAAFSAHSPFAPASADVEGSHAQYESFEQPAEAEAGPVSEPLAYVSYETHVALPDFELISPQGVGERWDERSAKADGSVEDESYERVTDEQVPVEERLFDLPVASAAHSEAPAPELHRASASEAEFETPQPATRADRDFGRDPGTGEKPDLSPPPELSSLNVSERLTGGRSALPPYAPPAVRKPLNKWTTTDEPAIDRGGAGLEGKSIPAHRPGLAKAMRYVAQEGPPARASEGLTAMRTGAGQSKASSRQETSFRAYVPSAEGERVETGMSRRWAMLSRFERGVSLPGAREPESGTLAHTATATDPGGEPHV